MTKNGFVFRTCSAVWQNECGDEPAEKLDLTIDNTPRDAAAERKESEDRSTVPDPVHVRFCVARKRGLEGSR
jgi:hypothetical protein